MLNTRYGIILIIISIFIEMLTCNSGYIVYVYLFSIPGFLYVYKYLFFFLNNLSDRFENKVLP